ncbi:hypothetical protein GCM10022290_02360 [Sagittula marina]
MEMHCRAKDVCEAEKPRLMARPPAFDGFIEHSKRVSPTCLITFEREEGQDNSPVDCCPRRKATAFPPALRTAVSGCMSIPNGWSWSLMGKRFASMRGSPSGPIASPARSFMTGATVSRSSIVLGPMADKASLQRTLGALRNAAPLTEMPDAFRQLQDHMARVKKAVTEPLS